MKFRAFPTATAAFLVSTAIAAAQPIVFVPEGSANSIRMVKADTGETVKQITGVEAVHGLAGAPGVPYLVAGSYAETDRAAIAEMAQPETVSANDHEAHHAPKESEPIGPSDAGISILSVLDATTGEIIRRIEVPGAVHHTAVSPDGRFAVATHPAGDGISVVDLTTFELTAFVQTGSTPNYVAFGSDPGVVYVSNTGNGTISEVDLSRGIVRRNMVAGDAPEHFAVDPEKMTLYAADADAGNVLELSLKDGSQLRSFAIGGTLHGIDLSDDRAALFVAGRGENKIATVALSSGDISFAALSPEPYHLTNIPGTGTFYVSSRSEPLVWIVNASDLSAIGEFPVNGEGHQMVALP
ncbi:YncE family protein [Aliiroseovarius sp.]|uniref:YncE family protein n=1 Tax=Aliiroseovarius sp. TaxID=1872442 RepID=UPI0026188300|nr:YncE family protein [Aliiroseovarius sp.]